ncbi:MAG: AAA family ATPase [Candidatus Diapherotrites archaeon]
MPSKLFGKPKSVELFKSEKYLYLDFVPERLPHRDAQIDELVHALQPIAEGKRGSNVFLFGPTGTGKTASAKFVLNELQEFSNRAKYVYVNCFEHKTRHSILSLLANFLGIPSPRRGVATDEAFAKFVEGMKKAGFSPVVVLDEFDQLMQEGEGSNLLYDLLRVSEHQSNRLYVVLISNHSELTSQLDARVRSSLTEQKIEFARYSPQELKDILKERANFAFQGGVLDEEAVNVAAAHASKLGGDCRIALESLLRAGRIAERENASKVSLSHLRKAFAEIETSSARKAVPFLSEPQKLMLRIIGENPGITSGEIYISFGKKSKSDFSQRHLFGMLSDLENARLIESEGALKGKGKTRSFRLKIAPQLLEKP